MAEYLIKEETMTGLADSFRYKLKNTDSLSIEDMRKLVYLMHYDLDNGVTLYDYNNNPVYSYSIAEANGLAELPSDVYVPQGYVFTGWSHTIDDINGTDIPLVVMAVYDKEGSKFKFVTLEENSSASISITNYTGSIAIDWGDGTIENFTLTSASTLRHTYSEIGEYVAIVTVPGDGELQFKSDNDLLVLVNLDRKHTKTIGDSAFCNCSGLTSIVIPDSVTSIGSDAFQGCTGLTSIVIPDSVTSIGERVFYRCTSLTSITIPNNVTSIGDGMFTRCTTLTSITIPDSVTSIGNNVFYGCKALTSIEMPDSLTSIGNNAFRDCIGLTSIVIPDSVTSIGSSAFYSCRLTSINIPDNVTSIGSQAFYNCGTLKSVTIPNSVTSIGTKAFYVTSVDNIYYNGTTAQWNAITFGSAWFSHSYNRTCTINCTDGTITQTSIN